MEMSLINEIVAILFNYSESERSRIGEASIEQGIHCGHDIQVDR